MAANVMARNRLTCTTLSRTLYELGRTLLQMDATARTLVAQLVATRRQIAMLNQRANSYTMALEAAGFRSKDLDNVWASVPPRDQDYAEQQPFKTKSLVDTCKQILEENGPRPFNKSQIEYLAAIGGYPFSTDDSKNSIDVTMRRLARQGFCEIIRDGGRNGNRYMLPAKKVFEKIQGNREALIERGEIKVPPPPKKGANSKTR